MHSTLSRLPASLSSHALDLPRAEDCPPFPPDGEFGCLRGLAFAVAFEAAALLIFAACRLL